ncbi:uncharacterized protein IUM83_18783 [Phytophthora cinnamomi]|uniref:uncharacterized protein n=1 Tax=Phytophthora cinnamomi TaxID=4785 RepID=UPI003559C1BC|nr:hypothetical protein IUM83_18783 [Phytophthora cinnamomi]
MPTFRVDADGDVEMSIPQPVYEFVSAPELTAWDQESLVNWRRERERYVEKIQQKCRTSNGSFDAAVMRVRDTVRERASTLQNGHIPDVQSFFKANLRMDMSEKDIDARVLKYFVDFDQLVEDHGFETLLGVGSVSATGYRDRMKQRCKLLIAGLAPAMLKVEIERFVLLQHKDAKADDVALRDLILERATAQQHYHLMQMEEKPDKRQTVTVNKKNPELKAKPRTSGEPAAKQTEKNPVRVRAVGSARGGGHFAQQCPTATEEQKAEARRRLDEARARKVKAARVAKSPGRRRVVINEVLEIPFRPDSGADCCFLPEEYLRELQAVDTSVHPIKLDNPVAVELAGGKVDHCHFECTVDLLLGTEEEFLLGDDLLKSLGIDVDGMIEQLAVGSLEQDDGDDLNDETKVGRDEAESVEESLGALIQDAEANGFPPHMMSSLRTTVLDYGDVWRARLGTDGPARLMAYLDRLDLDELQRQKQMESQAYSDAIAVQNHSANNNETPKGSPELAAQTQAMTKDSDNPYNPTVAESPECPGPSRELIATSPHVLSDGESAASSQGGNSTIAPAPQRSLNDDFVAVADDSSDIRHFCRGS